MRFLIILGLIYVIYKTAKSWINQKASILGSKNYTKFNKVDDDMVKDPCCGVYCIKSESIKKNINGKELYFCSSECKKKWIEKIENKDQ